MKPLRLLCSLALILLVAASGALRADVKTQEKSLVKFEGTLGRMVGLFGGKSAREGIVSTVAVKGDRKMTVTGDTAQIVDLAEEKVYDVDVRRKTYRVTTFAELRRRMQEARARAEEDARRTSKEASEQPQKDANEKELEVDFSVKPSGQRRTISGYECREVVMTIAVREKGRTLEDGGGLVMTANSWLAPRIQAMNEIAEFERRYAATLDSPFAAAGSAEQMAAAMAMYPAMTEAMSRFQAENANLDGTPLSTVMTIEAVKSKEQMAQQKLEEDAPPAGGSIGGMLGGLGKRIVKKPAAEADASPRTTIMTTTHDVLSVGTDVAADDVSLPAGSTERK